MNESIPIGLLDAIRNNRCVLFAGSGLSRGMVNNSFETKEQYLPTWQGLLILLLKRATALGLLDQKESAKLDKAVKEKKYLFVSEAIKNIIGAREFDNTLEDIFRNTNLKFTSRHELITRIPFLAIITTNYDKLIEAAYAKNGAIPPTYTFRNSSDVISALSRGKFFILKAHGDIDQKDSIILSEKNYRDIIYREPGYRAALNTIFITKTVLFLGAGLADIEVNLVLESVSETFNNKGTVHYAFVPWNDIADKEVMHWRDYFGIQLVRYKASKGHPEVEIFLKNIIEMIEHK